MCEVDDQMRGTGILVKCDLPITDERVLQLESGFAICHTTGQGQRNRPGMGNREWGDSASTPYRVGPAMAHHETAGCAILVPDSSVAIPYSLSLRQLDPRVS